MRHKDRSRGYFSSLGYRRLGAVLNLVFHEHHTAIFRIPTCSKASDSPPRDTKRRRRCTANRLAKIKRMIRSSTVLQRIGRSPSHDGRETQAKAQSRGSPASRSNRRRLPSSWPTSNLLRREARLPCILSLRCVLTRQLMWRVAPESLPDKPRAARW